MFNTSTSNTLIVNDLLYTQTRMHTQETDVIVNQVLDELGISLDHELGDITPGLEKPHVAQSSVPVYVYACVFCVLCMCACGCDVCVLSRAPGLPTSIH